MTWTYDPTDLAKTKNRVRLMVGDTDAGDPQLSDEEIQYFLDVYGTLGGAALNAARAIQAQYARQVTKAVGDLRISLSDRHKQYAQTVAELEGLADAVDPWQIYVGGQSQSEDRTDAQDTDLPQPRSRIGVHDFAGTGLPPDFPADPLDPFLSR